MGGTLYDEYGVGMGGITVVGGGGWVHCMMSVGGV